MGSFGRFLFRQWFLCSLAVIICAGLGLGLAGLEPAVKPWADGIDPRVTTAVVLFLMAFTLETDALVAAARAPMAVLLAIFINSVALPLVGWSLMPLQGTVDFACGVMIALCVPSTLASASVMTRKGGGNDAVSLLTTVITNGSCFLVIPFWLYLTTARKVELDLRHLVVGLVVAVLLPTIAGQMFRIPAVCRAVARTYKPQINATAQICIELIVFSAALRGGVTWRALAVATADKVNLAGSSPEPISGLSVLVMVVCMLGVHLAAWWVGWRISLRLGLPATDAVAVSFSGSEKTMPVGLLVAADPATFGTAHPFALFPMLAYHIGQLFMDSALAGWLKGRR